MTGMTLGPTNIPIVPLRLCLAKLWAKINATSLSHPYALCWSEANSQSKVAADSCSPAHLDNSHSSLFCNLCCLSWW